VTVIDQAFMAAYFCQDIDGHIDMLANPKTRGELSVTNKLSPMMKQIGAPFLPLSVSESQEVTTEAGRLVGLDRLRGLGGSIAANARETAQHRNQFGPRS
jgi:uncharacterized protein YbaR (Trm112 family)